MSTDNQKLIAYLRDHQDEMVALLTKPVHCYASFEPCHCEERSDEAISYCVEQVVSLK